MQCSSESTYAAVANLPFALAPARDIWPLFLLSNVVSSLLFSLQFVVNHEIDSIDTSSSNTLTAETAVDFGEWQLKESLSFAYVAVACCVC